MADWQCKAKRGLPVDEDSAWSGSDAKAAIFEWAGWPDNPDASKARQAFLAYDASADQLKGSYSLPFCTVKDGTLTAVRAGLNAATSRLPQTDDLPEGVRNAAQDVLDSYKEDDADRATEPEGRRVTYSRVLRLDTRAAGQAGTDLLALARDRAVDPAVFDEFPPYFFGGEISSNRWDAYDTRMGISTLRNYAEDAAAGVAYLRNHNTYDGPVGHSLTGAFTGAQGNGVARTRADFYMITDPESSAYVNKIRAGVVRDQSVGFFDGQWICSICGQDMMEWFSRDGCPHMLGFTYTPKDEAGKQTGEPVKARATIENAHLAEVSGVYDGATPGAMIDKARALAAAGELDYRTRELVQVRYRIRLPGGSRVWAVPDLGGTSTAGKEEEAVEPKTDGTTEQKTAGAIEHERMLTEIRGVVKGVLPADHAGHQDPLEAVRWLVAERARLVPLADDGRAYRTDLVAEALREGVRAFGAEFSQETYRDVLERSTLDVIKRMRDDWTLVGDKQFPKGRQTTDEGKPESTAPVRKEPASAYRG